MNRLSAAQGVQEILTSTVGFIRPVPAVVIPIAHPGGADAHARAAAVFVAPTLVHFCRWDHRQECEHKSLLRILPLMSGLLIVRDAPNIPIITDDPECMEEDLNQGWKIIRNGAQAQLALWTCRFCIHGLNQPCTVYFPGSWVIKNLPAKQETRIQALDWEDALE